MPFSSQEFTPSHDGGLNAKRALGLCQILRLSPEQRLSVSCKLAIFDTDETKIQGTGEVIHDGPTGRFAVALTELLREQGVEFDLSRWDQYRLLTGRSEQLVCKLLVALAGEHYRGVQLQWEELQKRSHEIVQLRFAEYMQQVQLVPGIQILLNEFYQSDTTLALCTSSAEQFIAGALSHFGILDLFKQDARVYGAGKKVADGRYCPDPFTEAANRAGIDINKGCVFGDSVSDFAAAALAGAPLVIIRPAGESQGEQDASLLKFLDELDRSFVHHADALTKTQLVIVSGWHQVHVAQQSKLPCIDKTIWEVTSIVQ